MLKTNLLFVEYINYAVVVILMAFVSAENVKPQQIVSILKLYKATNFDAKITAVNSKESFEFIIRNQKIIL